MKTYGYGRQTLGLSDILAVLGVLRSDFLTCGPKVREFEDAICAYTGAKYCVAVSSATAGLHIAAAACGIGPGDEAVTSPITFLASANCVRYTGASVRFADVEPDTANISAAEIERGLTERTRLLIPVHFAGQSCDMEAISRLARARGLRVIEDAAHAIGSDYRGSKVGSCEYSDMAVFSFHPVKNITTGEGGAVTTNDPELYERLKLLRSHGMEHTKNWEYEMRRMGFNYRLTDIQAALGVSQLGKLEKFKARRREIVEFYNSSLGLPHLSEREWSDACFHLYPVLVDDREGFYLRARKRGLNLQVHYIPVHTQPYYRELGFRVGDFPNAEAYYSRCVSLPLYPSLKDSDLREIVRRVKDSL